MWSPSDIVIGFGSSNWGAMNPMRLMTAAVGTIALKNLETTYLSWKKIVFSSRVGTDGSCGFTELNHHRPSDLWMRSCAKAYLVLDGVQFRDRDGSSQRPSRP